MKRHFLQSLLLDKRYNPGSKPKAVPDTPGCTRPCRVPSTHRVHRVDVAKKKGVEKPSCELVEMPKIEARALQTLDEASCVVIRGASGCRAEVFWEEIMKQFTKE